MAKSVDHFGGELATIRTGRANPALIDKVMVPYYGTPTPLNQLAQISAPEPRLLVVQVYDKSQIGAIEKALRSGDMSLKIRNVRRDEIHRVDQMAKNGEVAEDESKRAHTRLQKITEAQVERVDALAARKEHEVLEV